MLVILLVVLAVLLLCSGFLLGKFTFQSEIANDQENNSNYLIPEGVLDVIPLGIVIADDTGEIVFRNNTADAIVDSWIDGVVGRKVIESLHLSIEGTGSNEQVRTPGPPQRTIEVIAQILETEQKTLGSTAILIDVTEQIRTEAMRRDFVANVSHELKTPIGALSLLAETLTQETDPNTVARLSARLEAEAQRLGRIVDDILDLSRIESGTQDTIDVVDLTELINEVVDRLSTIALKRQIKIQTNLTTNFVNGDRLQLISLIHNVVENAIKYSEEKTQIKLELKRLNQSSIARLEVTDSGIGIPKHEIERVFERFYRVDRARSRQSGGTGLGLSIVRNVAVRHGGTVNIDSLEGQGTTVTVDLPIFEPGSTEEVIQ